MNIKDLMIGDYVFHKKYGNAKVEMIVNDFKGDPEVMLISDNIKHKDGYEYGYCYSGLDDIYPLPLTSEILEKNGWKYTNYNNETSNDEEYFVYDGIDIHIDNEGFEIRSIDSMNIQLHYVHQLQHIMHLCGIEKEIEL